VSTVSEEAIKGPAQENYYGNQDFPALPSGSIHLPNTSARIEAKSRPAWPNVIGTNAQTTAAAFRCCGFNIRGEQPTHCGIQPVVSTKEAIGIPQVQLTFRDSNMNRRCVSAFQPYLVSSQTAELWEKFPDPSAIAPLKLHPALTIQPSIPAG